MKKMRIRKNEKKEAKPKRRKGKIFSIFLSLCLIGGIAVVSLILVFALYVIITSPDFDKDKLYSKEASVIYYADGTELTRIGNENRVLVTYDQLPQVLVDAIIATEDSRFFQHSGLDIARFSKATIGQLLGRPGAGGASTITMQVVKKVYTNSEDEGLPGLIRKATDIYMSVFKIESNYTKEEILEFYVNTMWFAHDGNLNYTGIAGVEQGCQYYFGKSVSDITLAEASIIAGMFQNQRLYNPYKNPVGVRNRQTKVLTYMVNHGYITEQEKEDVLKIPIESLVRDRSNDGDSSVNQAVIDYVLNEVRDNTGLEPFDTPLKIHTTIVPNTQNVLNQLEKNELFEFPNDVMQEGVVVTSVKDGSVIALSGGRNYLAKGINRATDVKRQPGSTAKILFDYGPAIEYLNYSPSTMLLDEPTTYSNGTPIKNSDGKYMGEINLRTALVNSRNIPALRTFKAVYAKDPNLIVNFVHSLGIDYGKDLFESASIGGFTGVTPLQMSAAYGAFARGGYYIKPYVYTQIEVVETGEVINYKYEQTRVMSAETAYMITDVLISATEAGVGGCKISGTDIASKGGTSTIDSASAQSIGVPTYTTMDAWNITYDPEYIIAQWIGYDITTKDYYLTSKVGNNVRNAVMKAIGSRIYSQNVQFDKPEDVVRVEVEIGTFPSQLASEFTPTNLRRYESFKAGTEPTEVSTRFSQLDAPTNGNYTFSGSQLTLTWDGIPTPDAINNTYLQNFFNENYQEYASKYYEQRVNYNHSYVGTLGYNIYQKDAAGNLTYLGRTEGTSYTISNVPSGGSTYVIKSVYSIFTANMSNGLEISVKAIDNNVDDMLDNNDDNTQDDDNNTELPDENVDTGLD